MELSTTATIADFDVKLSVLYSNPTPSFQFVADFGIGIGLWYK